VPPALLACAPRAITRPAEALFPGCLYEVRLAEPHLRPMVALTIDDAPDPLTTPAILDTLRAHDARATFFVITGQVDRAAPLVDRMRREGHEIGNHFTSDRASIHLDSAAFERDLAAADSALGAYGPVRWARPGSGWYSRRMVRTMKRTGYGCALGSIYPVDVAHPWPALSARYILAHARPGAIVILHDRDHRGVRTAEVLGRVLPELRERGYRVVTLSELAGAAR
jgi:peptidoglycan/xylan/chitin deacetylase (PgdA/CDA1 family)